MRLEELEKVRKNLTKDEKILLASEFDISYETLGNILRGWNKPKKVDQIFIAAVKIINDRKNELNEASQFIQSL